MTNVLCITGMHRSGTSLTASWLKQCGLSLDAGSVIAPSSWNPKGHFEDREIVTLHETAINLLSPNSHGWKLYEAKTFQFQPPQLEIAKKIIQVREQTNETWGWKDPRTTHFLKQWKKLIPELKVLIIWRPATLVINSLLKRSKEKKVLDPKNKIQIDKLNINTLNALRLWILHNQLLYEYKKNNLKDTILIPLDVLFNKDEHIIKLLKKMDIKLNYIPINNVFDKKLLNQSDQLSAAFSLIEKIPKVSLLNQSLLKISEFKLNKLD